MKNISSTTVVIVSAIIGVVLLLGVVFALDGNDPAQEPVKLPILVEEFSDFECPACQSFYPTVESIKAKFGDQIEFEYKHFPLSQHPNALPAALASEAAREQGKFEEYYDLLFTNANQLSDEDLRAYGRELNLDMAKFNEDRESDEIYERVEADTIEGTNRAVNSTPTFFINGERVRFLTNDEETPEEKMTRLIEELIERAQSQEEEPAQDNSDNEDKEQETDLENNSQPDESKDNDTTKKKANTKSTKNSK